MNRDKKDSQFLTEIASSERFQKEIMFFKHNLQLNSEILDYCASIVAELELEKRRCMSLHVGLR